MKLLALCVLVISISVSAYPQQARGTLAIEATTSSEGASQIEIVIGGRIVGITDDRGAVTLEFPAGQLNVTVQRSGFRPQTFQLVIQEGETTRLPVQLQPEVANEQEITVTATRTGQRIEEVPLRVEVLQEEEIEEKALMTPGDIAMLLNETGGLRVQVTAPSLGAANVRVQGLRGRYTQVLADGLPLYGGQAGTIGLLQIPPLDLGQVEVIKGVASALYGSSALGGVVNLVSRQPQQAEHELLLNRTSLQGTDAVLWLAEPLKNRLRYTVLGGVHHQEQQDIDDDGWVDMAGYQRATLRPRVSWDDGAGRSMFLTVGSMMENRKGGTMANATVPDGNAFPEELKTRRFDVGVVGHFLRGSRVLSIRGSAMTQHHHHRFGDLGERDRHHTLFGEASLSGTSGKQTWTLGSALQADLYRSQDVSRFDYTYVVPAVFAQDDYAISSRLTLSGSGRVDFHSDYGAFFNPRLSALVRLPRHFTVRLSSGTGVFAPTPFTEETEAVGLTNLLPLHNLRAEKAWSASADLGWNASHVEFNASLFRSNIRDPIMLRLPSLAGGPLEVVNAAGPTRTVGTEFLARLRGGDFGVTFTHTFIYSTERDPNESRRLEVPLTPRHTAGFVAMWEKEGKGRVGIEIFYTGKQRLDDNPFRERSIPYFVFGALAERRFGPVRLFVNAENIGNTRQTRHDPLLRPARHTDGRWTVDAWAPLEGRVVNGGVRWGF